MSNRAADDLPCKRMAWNVHSLPNFVMNSCQDLTQEQVFLAVLRLAVDDFVTARCIALQQAGCPCALMEWLPNAVA